MGQRNLESAQFDPLRSFGPPPVEEHERLAAAVWQNLDVAPTDAANAGAKGLHHRLLGGEPGRKLRDPPAAVRYFVPRVDTLKEAVAVPADDVLNAFDLNDVDANGKLRSHNQKSYGTARICAWRSAPSARYSTRMTAQLIDGTAIAADIRAEVAQRVAALRARGTSPGLAAILVGDNPASISYVSSKASSCEEVGILSETFRLPTETTQAELLGLVARLNADSRFHCILPQLPLPKQIDERAIIDALDPAKDVDGLHPVNLGRVLRGETDGALPCTPHAVLQLLARTNIDPAGKHVVVVGRSTLVGRPLAVLLSNKAKGANATVTICHTGTPDISRYTRDADIVVMAAGRPNTLTADMVREGAVVIDVGTNRIDDASRKRGWRLVGDADFPALKEKVAWITPVPGGVGPMTVAMLLVNTVRAAERTAL